MSQDLKRAAVRIKQEQQQASTEKYRSAVLTGAWMLYLVAATARGHEVRDLRLKDVCGLHLQLPQVVGECFSQHRFGKTECLSHLPPISN